MAAPIVATAAAGWALGALVGLPLLLVVGSAADTLDADVGLGTPFLALVASGLVAVAVHLATRPPRPALADLAAARQRGGEGVGRDADTRGSWLSAAGLVPLLGLVLLLLALPMDWPNLRDREPTPSGQRVPRLVLTVVVLAGLVAVVGAALAAARRAERRLFAELTGPLPEGAAPTPGRLAAALSLRPVDVTLGGVGALVACWCSAVAAMTVTPAPLVAAAAVVVGGASLAVPLPGARRALDRVAHDRAILRARFGDHPA
ncbi:hypothetical protein [Nocardioides zeae]|uniref:Uncharacterized protein n=1 Tax=Nocardioides zeae TaxID=1457234 RepID=A0AAJ1X505_9ACTN|nr:hypothetical protein [Nocardioides zeae]MDQ1106132.1 hypothetical protein [Nocardioides zeae]